MKRRRDLNAHEIVRVTETAVSVLVTQIEPVGSDHREQHAIGDLLVQDLDEIHPKGDGIDVHEREIVAKLASSRS